MKKPLFLLVAAGFAASAQAYAVKELRADCQAADAQLAGKKSDDAQDAVRSARCLSYLAGFADSYAVSDYLAGKIGLKLNAYCLPREENLQARLVRSVIGHLEFLPANLGGDSAMVVASALAKSFPCPDSLESKK